MLGLIAKLFLFGDFSPYLVRERVELSLIRNKFKNRYGQAGDPKSRRYRQNRKS